MRKTITLPSGGTCTVRGMRVTDFAGLGEDIPTIYGKPLKGEPTPSQVKAGVRVMRVALLLCTSPITKDGVRRKIVEKDLDQLTDAEISIDELSDDDGITITNAVCEMSGIGKEAGGNPKSFQESSDVPDDGHTFEAIPLPAVSDPQVAAG